jgi:hypothetical protein
MPAVAFIVDQCLSMAGLESLAHGPSDLADRLVSDFNRALDRCGDLNPAVFFQVRTDMAEYVNAPVTLNVQVTQGSKAITIPSGYDPDWMAGCSILISGDEDINRLQNESANISPTLSQPYMGSSGTVSATVWHDWIRLPEHVENVMNPITIYDRSLVRAQSLQELTYRWYAPTGKYDYQWVAGDNLFKWQKPTDEPWRWFEAANQVQGDLVAGLMLDALPPAQAKLAYTAKVGIERVTTLQDQREYIMPRRKDHEILLPMVRWFFSSYMAVSVPKQELQADFEMASQTAANLKITSNQQKRYRYNPGR